MWTSTDAGNSWQRLPSFVRVEESHPQVRFNAPWNRAVQPNCHGIGTRKGEKADDWFEYEFFGRSIIWYATKNDESGIAEVSVDGVLAVDVDLYSPEPRYSARAFERDFGVAGWHTVKVRVTGQRNPASSDVIVFTDGFAHTD